MTSDVGDSLWWLSKRAVIYSTMWVSLHPVKALGLTAILTHPYTRGKLVVLGRKVGGHYGKQMGQDLLFWSRDILWDEFLEPAVRASRPHAQRIIVEPVAAQLTMSRVFWAGPLLPFFLFGGVLIQAVENVLEQPEPEFDAV